MAAWWWCGDAGGSFAFLSGGDGCGVCKGFVSTSLMRYIETTALSSVQWLSIYSSMRFDGHRVDLLTGDVVAVVFFHLENLLTQLDGCIPWLGRIVRRILTGNDRRMVTRTGKAMVLPNY